MSRPKFFSVDDGKELKRMHEKEELSYEAIARLKGSSGNTVYRAIKKYEDSTVILG